jgi:hypothetical protein
MKAIIVCVALIANLAHAAEVKVSLLECKTAATTSYAFDIETAVLKDIPIATGIILSQTTRFSVQDDRLFVGGKKLTKAKQILFQCNIDGVDLVVIRRIHVTIATPLRLLSAFAGHPMEINEIAILKVVDGKLIGEREMTRKLSSWDWTANVMQ